MLHGNMIRFFVPATAFISLGRLVFCQTSEYLSDRIPEGLMIYKGSSWDKKSYHISMMGMIGNTERCEEWKEGEDPHFQHPPPTHTHTQPRTHTHTHRHTRAYEYTRARTSLCVSVSLYLSLSAYRYTRRHSPREPA